MFGLHLPAAAWLLQSRTLCIMQVAEFWHEVELATNVRQQRMFQAVNAHLEKLSRGVDDVVGGLLSLRLEPVLVRMDPPSAAEFHCSLQELFEKGAPARQPACAAGPGLGHVPLRGPF